MRRVGKARRKAAARAKQPWPGVAAARSAIMRANGPRDSLPEVALRSALHRAGLRFRLHRRIEGVNVDVSNASLRLAVLMDGCFWHACPQHGASPKTRLDYWLPKLAANVARDKRQTRKLRRAGWRVFRVWEHDCMPPRQATIDRIMRAAKAARKG